MINYKMIKNLIEFYVLLLIGSIATFYFSFKNNIFF